MKVMFKFEHVNFVTENSIQTSLLKDNLQKSCGYVIDKQKYNAFIDKLKLLKGGSCLSIIDLDYFSDTFLTEYLEVIDEYDVKSYEVLLNVDKTQNVESIMRFPNVRGVFYRSDTLELITKGLKCICDGEYWLSRELSCQLIDFYREQSVYVPRMLADLTEREHQVLKLLLIGASNQQIADSLFVSENTVKTHLHNVFKKIKVKNRIQALMWAKNQPDLRKA